MNGKDLVMGMGFVDEKFIHEAAKERINIRKNAQTTWRRWRAIAACFAFILTAMVVGLPKILNDPANPAPGLGGPSGLPMLEITGDSSEVLGGFEGYMAYDISEIINNNPWTGAVEISTLPVYKNMLTYDESHRVAGGDFDKMREFLLNVASRMGMDADNLEITNDAPNEKEQAIITEKFEGESVPEAYFSPKAVIVEDNGIKIEVAQQMTAKISFEPAIALPEEYNFANYAAYADVVEVAQYLKETYKDLIGMNNPQINISGGDYNIHGQQGYNIEFYEDRGDITAQITNCNFYRVAFYCDDEGKLFLARIFQPDLSGKVGDYPIITVDKAKELLENGNYITTVPKKFSGLKYAAKVELVYRTRSTEQYFMPYYRFYVELPDMERENGLKTYGAYYVPAVKGEYISNMPVWDGTFFN